MTGKQLNQAIKQISFVIILVAAFILIIAKLDYFFSSFLGAFTLYVLLRTTHRKMVEKGWNKLLATSTLLLATVLIVFVIGGTVFGIVFSEVKNFQPQVVIDNVNQIREAILDKTGYNIFSTDVVDQAIRSAGNFLPSIFSKAGSILTNGMMMIFILFFMLQESKKMEDLVGNNLPLKKGSIDLLKKETQNMVVSNSIGISVILIGQAIFAGLAYWILGAGNPIVWGLLTGVFGLIPVIGTAGIWLPLSVNLLFGGFIWQGIVLIIYGAVIISSVDNVIRMVFLKKYADVHPLTAIFGIILGMNLFGFWGIIFGPLVISGFFLLFRIYKTEYLTD
ncbi:MAG: AI-2E family transporter [Dysgonamonadaceae bacterium]|jgi:predicted PurR-regulated permease PerM|nr:AI-2E family transporter [Dysgonamonadaceae bacterium]